MSEAKEKKSVQVSYGELVEILKNVKGATPATFVAVTEVKMNKTGNPYHGKVTKKQKSNVFINFDYATSVNRARAKEGNEEEFVAKPRKWGAKIPGTPVIQHNDEFYLEARFLTNEPKVEYFMDSILTDPEVFEAYMPSKKTESIKEHQGLEAEIVIRDFKISNIHEITVGGAHYVRNDI
jgi:hypothetical protein